MYLIKRIWALYFLLENSISQNCPLLNSINYTLDNLFPFPTNYFPDIDFDSFSKDSIYYPCPKVSREAEIAFNIMSWRCVESLCPLHPNFTSIALQSLVWPNRSPALCEAVRKNNTYIRNNNAMDKPKMNIIYLGGSFTAGSGTQGSCFINGSDIKSYTPRGDDWYCGWAGYFLRWMQSYLPNMDVNGYNLAQSGCTAYAMANRITEGFEMYNLKLTKYDIIFIDHSVNDAELLGRDQTHVYVKNGIETLIRRIIHYCMDDCPNVIVLDQWAHLKGDEAYEKPPDSPNTVSGIYKNVAKHYNFPLWSFKDLIWSTFENDENMRLPLFGWGTHPPWHIHMFIANLYANIYLNITSTCGDDIKVDQKYSMPLSTNSLPQPLYDVSSFSHNLCDTKKPIIIKSTAESTFHPDNVTAFEGNPELARVGWREYIDYHTVPGYIINSLSAPENRRLRFNMTNIDNLHREVIQPDMIIKIVYLRTYHNTGKVKLSVCGKELYCSLDALFPGHHKYKVSVPEVFVYKLSSEDYQQCNSHKKEMNFEIIYDPTDEHDREFKHVKDVRGHQKFKLMSVEMCYESDEVRRTKLRHKK